MDLMRGQESLRDRLPGASALPNAMSQAMSAMEQLRVFPDSLAAQAQAIVNQSRAIGAFATTMDSQRLLEGSAMEQVRKTFESSGICGVREAMIAFERATQPLSDFVDQLSLPTQGATSDALRALLEPSQSVRDVFERVQSPSIKLVVDEIMRRPPFATDLSIEVAWASPSIRKYIEGVADDSLAAMRALDVAEHQLDVVAQALSTTTGAPSGAVRTQRQSSLSLADWLAIVQVLLVVATMLMQLEGIRLQTRGLQQDAQGSAANDAYQARMLGLVEKLVQHSSRAAEVQPQRLVVGRNALTVRSEPGRGYRVGTAHPNQTVVQIAHRGRWLKIRFEDHLEDRTVEGWVLKHRLKESGSDVPM